MKNFKRIFHGIGALALSAVLLLGAGQTAKAAADSPSLDFSMSGSSSIEVSLVSDDGVAVTDGTLTIYKVAVLGYDDGNMDYTYTSEFSSCTVDLDSVTQDSTDSSALAAIADELAAYVSSNSVTGTSVNNTTGTVTFDGLELGLYLVVQTTASTGYESISPFVVTVPIAENDVWVYNVDASPKVETMTAIPEEETPEETPEEEDPGEEVVETVTETLVQTGQLNWPIPVLTVAGLVMILFGVILMMTDNRRRMRR